MIVKRGVQCPGCGDMMGKCACTFASVREALERDRAAMSDRLAASEMRANEWAALASDLLTAPDAAEHRGWAFGCHDVRIEGDHMPACSMYTFGPRCAAMGVRVVLARAAAVR